MFSNSREAEAAVRLNLLWDLLPAGHARNTSPRRGSGLSQTPRAEEEYSTVMIELLTLSKGRPALQRKLQLLGSCSDLLHYLQRVVRLRLYTQRSHLKLIKYKTTFKHFCRYFQYICMTSSNPQVSLKINIYSFLIKCCDLVAALWIRLCSSFVSNSVRREEVSVTRTSKRDSKGCNCAQPHSG